MIQNRPNFLNSIPPVTKNLIIINLLLWLATIVFRKTLGIDLVEYLGLHYFQADRFNAAQMVTYMFMHDPCSRFSSSDVPSNRCGEENAFLFST